MLLWEMDAFRRHGRNWDMTVDFNYGQTAQQAQINNTRYRDAVFGLPDVSAAAVAAASQVNGCPGQPAMGNCDA